MKLIEAPPTDDDSVARQAAVSAALASVFRGKFCDAILLLWNGETGLINQEMLGRHLKGVPSPVYYIAGPPAMVKGLHEMLRKSRIRDDDIRVEEFAGY
jgi:predicted ferric reductase